VHFAAENFTRCLRGPEGKEGVASFIEKRRPIWFEETS
jgi:isohexenylglutaconyl-CoA hydratase